MLSSAILDRTLFSRCLYLFLWTRLCCLMGTCGQPGYVYRDFCLEQGIEFIIFCLNQGIDLSNFVLNWVKCLKQGIKNRNSVLNRVGKSAIFVLNRVRVWGAAPHLPTQGYSEFPPSPGIWTSRWSRVLAILQFKSTIGAYHNVFSFSIIGFQQKDFWPRLPIYWVGLSSWTIELGFRVGFSSWLV